MRSLDSHLQVNTSLDDNGPAPGSWLGAERQSVMLPNKLLEQTRRGLQQLLETCLRTFALGKNRRLHVRETISLGDKRFVSIVEVDGIEYLIGGGSTVALLTQLSGTPEQPQFTRAMDTAWRGAASE